MTRWRPHLELPAFLALALLCAAASNRLAGPARRLSWTRPPVSEAPAPAPTPVPEPPKPPATMPAPAKAPSIPKAAPAPVPTPAPIDPAQELLDRFPLVQGAMDADVTFEEVLWLRERGVPVLDARRTGLYELGHIPGARSLPIWEDGAKEKVQELAAHRDPRLPVVVYCSGGGCEDSHLLAKELWLTGFQNLRIYAGGFPDWQEHGRPVAQGSAP